MRTDLIGREMLDVYLLLDHISGRAGIEATDLVIDVPSGSADNGLSEGNFCKLIDVVTQLQWPPPGSEPGDKARTAAILLKARDKLNDIAYPANGESVAFSILMTASGKRVRRLCEELERDRQISQNDWSRDEIAINAYPHLGEPVRSFRLFVNFNIWILLIGTLLAVSLSWHVASGKLVLSRLNELKLRAAWTAAQISALSVGGVPGVGSAQDGDNTADAGAIFDGICRSGSADEKPIAASVKAQVDPQHAPAPIDNKILLPNLCDKLRAIFEQRFAADVALNTWYNELPHRAAPNPPDQPELVKSAFSAVSGVTGYATTEQNAGDFNSLLATYVLPMLYGLVGSTAAVTRSLSGKLRLSTLTSRDQRLFEIQLILGVIIGACLGLFSSPSGSPPASPQNVTFAGNGVGLTPSALAFLVGFSVESVFKWLDRLIVVIFSPSASDPVQTAHSQPQPRRRIAPS